MLCTAAASLTPLKPLLLLLPLLLQGEPSFELPDRLKEFRGEADDKKALLQWRQEQQVCGRAGGCVGALAAGRLSTGTALDCGK